MSCVRSMLDDAGWFAIETNPRIIDPRKQRGILLPAWKSDHGRASR